MLPVYELPAAVHHRLYQSRLPARDPLADHRLNTQRLRGAGPSARPARQPEHCPQGHKRPPLSPSPLLPRRIQTLELDEFWSFAGSKKQPRWTWYAFDRERRRVVAFINGRRTDESGRSLRRKLGQAQINTYHTDKWPTYGRCFPGRRHHMGKGGTSHIERNHLISLGLVPRSLLRL